MRIRLYLLTITAALAFASPAAAENVPVEVSPGVTVELPKDRPGTLEVVEDRPGHYVLTGRITPVPTTPPTAAAGVVDAWPEPTFAGQRPASMLKIGGITARAKRFWATTEDRSLRPVGALNEDTLCPDGVTLYTAPAMPNAWGNGWHHKRPDGTMSCAVWLSDDLARSLTSPAYPARRDACTVLTHELGHAYGLDHTPTGVMSGGNSRPLRLGAWAPFFCRQWAHRVVK